RFLESTGPPHCISIGSIDRADLNYNMTRSDLRSGLEFSTWIQYLGLVIKISACQVSLWIRCE
ncbi:MAG: hypothetical protein P8R38_03215, partial [Planctomycetota bacterium]|nr:hypothetical protein [Planctomycetota bacterium]